jgi:hypothetical protein
MPDPGRVMIAWLSSTQLSPITRVSAPADRAQMAGTLPP